MIDYKLRYQASIFLNASDIAPNPKNITELIEAFSDKGFLPNIFQEISGGSSNSQNRVRLQSPDNEWGINIATTRIDVERNPIALKGSNLGAESDFCIEAADFFCRILKKFPIKAHRLSFLSRFILNEMSQETLNAAYTKLFNSPGIYKDNTPFEWGWKVISRVAKEMNEGNSESFNFVTSISRIHAAVNSENVVSDIDRLELTLDINSLPLNKADRFGCDEINSFFNSVSTWHEELKRDMLAFVK